MNIDETKDKWCYGNPDLGINEQWVYILMCQNVFNYEAQSKMKSLNTAILWAYSQKSTWKKPCERIQSEI